MSAAPSRVGEPARLWFIAPVIDLHSHLLAGIDDGPETIEGSVELARAAVSAGTRTMLATPHVSARYPNDAATIAQLVVETRTRLASEEVPLEVLGGAEVALTRVPELDPSELSSLSLGGGPWILLEPPFSPSAGPLSEMVLEIQRWGHRILLAHPERCPAFHRNPSMLDALARSGVLLSLTAGSLVGSFGDAVRRFALELVQEELVHNVASDAHDTIRRPPGVSHELEEAGLGLLAEWLTVDVPEAILAGREIPTRPPFGVSLTPRSRRLWSRRR